MRNKDIPVGMELIKMTDQAEQKPEEDSVRMDTVQSGSRQLWLDALRAAAACAVVMMHTLTGAVDIMNTAAYPQGRQMLILMDLVTWCVPVFLILSGYLFLNPQKQISFGRMLSRYCLRIVLALLIFGIPFSCLELIMTEKRFRIGMLWEGLVMVLTMRSWSHMWYLYLILMLYVLTPAIKWLLQRIPHTITVIFMGILLTGSSLLPFWNKVSGAAIPALPDGMIYLFYYLYGYFLWIRKERGDKKEALVWGCVTIAVLAGMTGSRLGNRSQLQMAYNYPPTVLLSVALMHFARAVHTLTEQAPSGHKRSIQSSKSAVCRFGRPVRAGITNIAAMSFCIYLIHPVFLNLFYKFLHITPLNYPFLPALFGFFAVTLCLSAAGAWILRKIPPLRKYVL